MNVLLTGGAGFIGSNVSKYYLERGDRVTIIDNFSRKSGYHNIVWLKNIFKKNLKVIKADIRFDNVLLKKSVNNTDLVIHLAGQVAVTTSVKDPRYDFENNLVGTFNILESIRTSKSKPVLIYSSTNKVYGGLEDVEIKELKTRFAFNNLSYGISEKQGLDFHSPYGCSKGAADQYVRDYARIYGLQTVVFRQSCIYGPRQFGIEDQGWLAWFMIALSQGKPIAIYGTGKQVRDILYIDDLMRAYHNAFKKIKKTSGQIYNIGGGRNHTLSVWYELKPILENLFKRNINVVFKEQRAGDQLIYISDIRKAKSEFNWEPKVSNEEGIQNLYKWIIENNNYFSKKFDNLTSNFN